MRYLMPLFIFFAVAAVHTALSASLESPEKEEKSAQHDGLTELQKIDLMEFEAAQKAKAAQVNVTEEQNEEDTRYLGEEAAQDESEEEHVETEDESTEGVGNSNAAAHEESESESTEDTDGRQRREHHETVTETVGSLDEVSQDLHKEQDVLE
ncbi:cyclin-dependent kinase 11A-like [Melanotaenia boesemani]|uniref:cyclin-dependent kinase 11A-like n=1 Tax=Melanotaenia boesemani TaxID=1250792 RepID=UPI001C03E347|nr:cyclin-dependent kinase 11A-like [Melanotaenia boesemani]